MMNTSLDFYHKHRSIQSRLPNLPPHCLSDYDLADWLLNRSDFAWLELDIQFDVQLWKKEILNSISHLVNHRENSSNGWRSACIHGIDISSTGAWTNYGYTKEDDVPYQWTPLADTCPNIKRFWSEFPYDSYRRIRIMEVTPGGYINPHSDRPGKLPGEENFDALKFGVPINVAVIHPDDCHMTLENLGCVPWAEGKAFIINIRNYHSVVNLSDQSRYHIIAHGQLDKKINEFTELVARSFKKQHKIQNECNPI